MEMEGTGRLLSQRHHRHEHVILSICLRLPPTSIDRPPRFWLLHWLTLKITWPPFYHAFQQSSAVVLAGRLHRIFFEKVLENQRTLTFSKKIWHCAVVWQRYPLVDENTKQGVRLSILKTNTWKRLSRHCQVIATALLETFNNRMVERPASRSATVQNRLLERRYVAWTDVHEIFSCNIGRLWWGYMVFWLVSRRYLWKSILEYNHIAIITSSLQCEMKEAIYRGVLDKYLLKQNSGLHYFTMLEQRISSIVSDCTN